MSVHIGIDVGGTFTDLVVLEAATGKLALFKVPSTRPPTEGVLHGLRRVMDQLTVEPAQITRLVHGSTVATNAILEGRWAQTALLTTAGFRDVLEIARQNRPSLYDLSVERPAPLVPRARRFGITERLDAQGRVIKPLDQDQVTRLIPRLKESESIAICYLFSYLNPAHEEATRALLVAQMDVPITISSEILGEYREYERCATTVMSAALGPVVGRYLQELKARVRQLGIPSRLQVMQSNGGIASAERASRQAVSMLFSGPAGGVAGARFVGVQAGFSDLITFDMGGTSTDVSLVRNGQISLKSEGLIAGRPVRLPMVDIHSIGAGGGSLAWIDAGGALRVGPQSAGAEPGPACYGKGDQPTVTDAQLVLGRLDEQHVLGDRALDRGRAERAMFEKIAQPLGLSLEEAASGILEVADAQMERALRVITVERGHDPRRFALLAFGGAGPLHAGALAQRLDLPTVIIPPLAGVLCALGLLVADRVQDVVRTLIQPLDAPDLAQIAEGFGQMQREAEGRFGEKPVERLEVERALDLRYRGQSYELTIELGDATLTLESLAEATRLFHERHRQLYGYAMPQRPVEMVNLRLRAVGHTPQPILKDQSPSADHKIFVKSRRSVYFRDEGWLASEIHERGQLAPVMRLAGPAIIQGRESTIVLMPKQRGRIDEFGNLIIESEGAL
jgi:N-methylhydantoinase A